MSTTDESVLQEFLAESLDHLDGIEDSLLQIEADGAEINEELVNQVFRAVHTIKGGAGFLNLQKISQVCHAQENILNLIRNRQMVPTNDVVTTLLITLDTIKTLLNDISLEADADVSSDLERLNRILTIQKEPADIMTIENEQEIPEIVQELDQDLLNDFSKRGFWVYYADSKLQQNVTQGDVDLGSLVSILERTGSVLASNPDMEQIRRDIEDGNILDKHVQFVYATILEPSLFAQMLQISERSIYIVVDQNIAQSTPPPPPPAIPTEILNPTPPKVPSSVQESVHSAGTEASDKIKVSLSVVDNLMTLAGELVLARNQLVQSVTSKDFEAIERSSRQLNFITSELQMNIMATRMQPVGNVFNKFRRIVRDMSQKMGKKVKLVISGEDVELDKNIIESIGDPLTHIVRNSMDHGIESPQDRTASGKDSVALLQIMARYEAGMVVLEITDDGRGIDPDRIIKKALEKGVINAANAEMMSEKEILQLIFAPGFSTADVVTDISGRGVGMDVVRTTFARLGGAVDVNSTKGKGTTLQIRLPLTLAIIPAIMIKAANQVFAIPQVNLQELVRIAPEHLKSRINHVGDSVFLRLREELLPLISIREILNLQGSYLDPETGEEREDRRRRFWDRREVDEKMDGKTEEMRTHSGDRRSRVSGSIKIAVVSTGHVKFGLVVDGFLDTEEVVLKPLGTHLQNCNFYSGATILGDGHPALIFDVAGIAESWLDMAVVDDMLDQAQHEQKALEDKQSLIILRGGEGEYFAAPLGLITRIEEIKAEQIEKISGKVHMHYRNSILPLFTVDSVAQMSALPELDTYYVVLFKVQGKEVGLLVSAIVDTVESQSKIDHQAYNQPGIMGTAIIDGRTVFLLDLYGIAVVHEPALSREKTREEEESSSGEELVLVLDDSVFFRSQIEKFVKEAGYEAITAEDGLDGLNKLKNARRPVTMILTDIEMPNMDGLGFTKAVRAEPEYEKIPIVAITSLMGNDAEKAGYDAGVNRYLIKLDREKIIETLHEYHMRGQ